MTEKSVSPVVTTEEKIVTKTETGRKVAATKAAVKPRVKPSHPSTADMVKSAIKTLSERSGSSLQAIKKYITATYKIDADKQAPFIKKYLKAAVTAGTLVQTKGKGASGSFKIAVQKPEAPKAKPKKAVGEKKAAKPKKPDSPKKVPVKKTEATTKAAAKKPASPKKAPAKKVVSGEKKTAAAKSSSSSAAATTVGKVAKPKAPSKTKKAVKAPTAKPKPPKPKKSPVAKAAKPAAAKKPAAQKK